MEKGWTNKLLKSTQRLLNSAIFITQLQTIFKKKLI